MAEYDIIVGGSSQGECITAQGNIFDLRQDILQVAAAIIKGDGDHGSACVTNTKYIAMLEEMVEAFITSVLPALIREAIQGLFTQGMRMEQIVEAIALHYLEVIAGNEVFT